MTDPYDAQVLIDLRKAEIAEMPAELKRVIEAGEPIWDTAGMQADFEALGFMAPYIVVRRRADNVKGSLQFAHSPRYYFNFQAD